MESIQLDGDAQGNPQPIPRTLPEIRKRAKAIAPNPEEERNPKGRIIISTS
jgi:hypothetical protein